MERRNSRGLTIFFTGLSASGKSTLARGVADRLARAIDRPVVVLDGDELRREISADLGFTRSDRDEHVRRVSELAAEAARRGGVALCSLIAPYDASRRLARARLAEAGGFALVYLSASIDTCEHRDPKGLYGRARAGQIAHFTGISDPYEPPDDADLEIDTATLGPDEAAERVMAFLHERGLID